MRYIVSSEEIALIDKYTIEEIGIPELVLMERAALGVFDFIKSKFDIYKKILVVVEGGNNGADGLALARMLASAGYETDVYYVEAINKQTTSFLTQLNIAKKSGVNFIDEILNAGYDVVVDAIFGVGLKRAVMGEHAKIISTMNEMIAYKIAVDICTGIDATTGFVLGIAFQANTTITFGYKKLGHIMGIGYEYSGNVIVCDIGFSNKAIDFVNPHLFSYDEADVDKLLPARKADSHKGTYGKIGIIGGCKNMAGAALFSAEAALRTGCGLVKICTVEENRTIFQTRLPEAMLTTYDPEDIITLREAMKDIFAWSDVLILGPGLGRSETADFIVERVLRVFDKTVVLDADGLYSLANNLNWLEDTKTSIVVTPHLMEMSRLTGNKTSDIKGNKYDEAKRFARENKLTVVLKDARTIVSNGEHQAYINTTGNNGMATGGSGDVLTGIIASLIGQGLDNYEAAKLGVCLHGLAGDYAAEKLGCHSMIAGDIVKSITGVLEKEEYNY